MACASSSSASSPLTSADDDGSRICLLRVGSTASAPEPEFHRSPRCQSEFAIIIARGGLDVNDGCMEFLQILSSSVELLSIYRKLDWTGLDEEQAAGCRLPAADC